jgi:hypothetical protein
MEEQLGFTQPGDLVGREPYDMYDDLCRITGQRHDPCLLEPASADGQGETDQLEPDPTDTDSTLDDERTPS